MSTQQEKTKKGAAAIYVVIFTATLLSIISLSFVRLMLSEMGRTTNYSLSQSAYNSALAGIEDAKIVLLRYQNCVSNPNYTVNGVHIDCAAYKNAFQYTGADNDSNKAKKHVEAQADNCDLVGQLLGYNTSNHETIIQTSSDPRHTDIQESAETFDQAYTCVKVSTKNKNYLTTLTTNYPTKIVPIRTVSADETNNVNRIVLSWFSRKDLTTVFSPGTETIDTTLFRSFSNSPAMNGSLTRNNIFRSNVGDYKNNFGEKPIVPSVIQATLVQTAQKFKLSEFYSAKNETTGYHTNRGTITLRPSTANPYGTTLTKYSNHLAGVNECGTGGNSDCFSDHGGPFATSATKSQNTPFDVHCYLADNINTTNGYACTADIFVPKPIGYSSSNKRNYTTFFLVLSLPYGAPQTEVSVELKSCDNNSSSIYSDSDGCRSIDFDGVQPVVDSTGRANDLFRRIEARVELVDTYYPFVNYALAVNDEVPNNDDDNIVKNFYVTKNCSYSQSRWDSTSGDHGAVVVDSSASCPNSAPAD